MEKAHLIGDIVRTFGVFVKRRPKNGRVTRVSVGCKFRGGLFESYWYDMALQYKATFQSCLIYPSVTRLYKQIIEKYFYFSYTL